MAQGYALRYFKDYDLNGHNIRLDIYKKYLAVEYAPAPKEIGKVLQGLSLDVQGEQDDITSPIVKTSLSMTFVDAPGIEKGKKTGDWEEFYTPDSTGYKVILSIDGEVYWSGYVTPDSFEEDLEYHGSVTIVARDNIGHMQDFPFDAEGNAETMITVRDLINTAWSKVECLLSLSYASGSDVVWPTCEGYNALDCLVNVEALEDENWFTALESVLDSFGLVMRFVGNNTEVVMPLRAIPCLDKERLSLVDVKPMLLEASGHRSLMPAMKSIEDVGDYDVQKEVVTRAVQSEDFTGSQSSYSCRIEGDSFGREEHLAPVWPIQPKESGWRNTDTSTTAFFDISQYALGYFLNREEDEISVKGNDVMYIASNNLDDRSVKFRQLILCRPFSIAMHFGLPVGITNAGAIESYKNLRLRKIIYQLTIVDGVNFKYWDGDSWINDAVEIAVGFDTSANATEFGVAINFDAIDSESTIMELTIKKIEYYSVGPIGLPDRGVYARLLKLTLNVPEDFSIMESMTVKSVYDESYNYLIGRDCHFVAPEQPFMSTKVIKNGIYLPVPGYRPASRWQWPNRGLTSLQAIIAQQILMYYSKPNSLITGTLVAIPSKGEILDFNCLWSWHGKKFALTSGQLDLLTGFIERAKLREFNDWEQIWPNEGLLMTEDGANYVISQSGDRVKVGKIYYNLISERGDYVMSESGERVITNGKS